MKKQSFRILFIVTTNFIVSIFFSDLKAQNTTYGIKTGLNSASLDLEEGVDFDSKTGFYAGGLAHIHVTRHIALQPELVYSCQGGERPTYKLKLGYLNLPVLVQYMAGSGFRLQTGPQLGFLVSAKQKSGDVEIDVDDAYDNIDVSWVIGAAYLFKSGLGVDLRYNIGLTDIADAGSTDISNRVVQLGLFYHLRKRR